MEFKHRSVLLNETIENLCVKPEGTYVDGTLGGGGHAYEVLKRLSPQGRFIGIDQDADALLAAGKKLQEFGNVTLIRSNYCNIKEELMGNHIEGVDGIVLDLGVSSYQLDTPNRGFSYMHDAPLDMRMNREGDALTARTVVNDYPPEKLLRIIDEYGEERFASAIVSAIVRARNEKPIETTTELSDIICSAIPKKLRMEGHHPAKKTFQAIRIEVNRELDAIAPSITDAAERLVPGGKLVVISFQSLEDRIVKNTFNKLANPCICPRDFPVCVCGRKPQIRIDTKKPILPTERELNDNPRARSAKLRIATKCNASEEEKGN